DPLGDLTGRELEVLQLVAEGLTDRGIAERLWVTPKTVETHVRHILQKLDLPIGASHNRRVHAVLAYLRAYRRRPAGFRRGRPAVCKYGRRGGQDRGWTGPRSRRGRGAPGDPRQRPGRCGHDAHTGPRRGARARLLRDGRAEPGLGVPARRPRGQYGRGRSAR